MKVKRILMDFSLFLLYDWPMTFPQDNPLRASDVRQHNEKMVLFLIYQAKRSGVSQSEVVQSTGLKAPTVFRIFTHLEEGGLIEPLALVQAESLQKKGRRPVSYRVRENALYTIGLEFWVDCITLGMFNFAGDLVYEKKIDLAPELFAHEAASKMVALIREVLKEQAVPDEKILGIGVAGPGQVNVARREIVYYPRILDMRNFPVADILEDALALPVFLHNNCSAIALSEYRYGGYHHGDSLFTFLLRSGVNGAFVNQDRIYITSQSTTLESGHIPIDLDGPKCVCGQNGCLQSYMTMLNDRLEGHTGQLLQVLEEPLRNGDPAALAVIDEAARYLFAAVKTVIRFFRPKAFLIVSSSPAVGEALARAVSRLREEQPGGFDFGVIDFFSHAYCPHTALRGASDLVINAYFA